MFRFLPDAGGIGLAVKDRLAASLEGSGRSEIEGAAGGVAFAAEGLKPHGRERARSDQDRQAAGRQVVAAAQAGGPAGVGAGIERGEAMARAGALFRRRARDQAEEGREKRVAGLCRAALSNAFGAEPSCFLSLFPSGSVRWQIM